jgi:putative two-component system response regulator
MPHIDGFHVHDQLSSLNDPLMPPIIYLTARDDRDYRIKALSKGARDFIGKPFDLEELLMRVNNLLQAHLSVKMLHNQKDTLEALVTERTQELYQSRLDVVQRLGKAAEYKDEETGNHILRVSNSSALIARTLGWAERDVELIYNAAPMHDIGKIGVPDNILLKPGKLDDVEWRIMQTHTIIGAELLQGDTSDLLSMAREIAISHHEKWDGSGYPYGLKGKDIPESGRIVAAADVFDALTSERPYKRAWAIDDALNLLREGTGQHFDPEVVEAFFHNLDEILSYRNEHK